MKKVNHNKKFLLVSILLGTIGGKVKKFWNWYAGLFRGAPWYKKTCLGIVSLIVAFFIFLIMVDMNFLWLFGKSPSLHAISHPQQDIASEVYSSDGKLIGRYFRENRTQVKYEDISPMLIKTLISTEDERFYEHFGIDIKGMFSAAVGMMHGNARGASTITQQLVKNMFKMRSEYSTGFLGYIPGVRMLIMKSKEWISAVKVEMFYSKKQILTMYLNTVDFGSNTYGIKTAAKTYFNATPKDLTMEQCATLVGMLKATTYYNPKLNPENSIKRRNIVLGNLFTHHIISRAELDSLKELPIKLNYNEETNYDGQALYFREAIVAEMKDWCKQNNIDFYRDGLKIYTTVDTHMQKYAEAAVNKQMRIIQKNFDSHWGKTNPWQNEKHQEIPHFIEDLAEHTATYKQLKDKYPNRPDSVTYFMNLPHKVKLFDYDDPKKTEIMSTMDSIRYMERFMHCGFVAMEPQTGFVKAWVGDIDFSAWKYDKVLSERQPGSTFKLFDYSAAFNQGMSPCDTRVDQYVSIPVKTKEGKDSTWVPRNANGNYSGREMSLKAAFAQSVNSVAVQIAQEVGMPSIIKVANAMGIKSALVNQPSTSLGASDVSLLDLVDAYCTAVNDGLQHDPVLVTRIEDKDGKVIYQYNPQATQAIPYETAFLMQQMLQGGITEPGGTSRALWQYIHPWPGDQCFGGKTGTSSNHSDAWFVGVTPNLVAGCWVGGEHRCIHFRTGALGQGSRTALPVYGEFMNSLLNNKAYASNLKKKFPQKPKVPIGRSYSCQSAYQPVRNDSASHKGDSIPAIDEGEIDDEIDNGATEPTTDKPKESKKESKKELKELKKEPKEAKKEPKKESKKKKSNDDGGGNFF